MEKTIVKYVRGLSENASGWERRNHKKYGGLAHICRQIEYDIRHGATPEEVASMLSNVRNAQSFSTLRKSVGAIERLSEVESHFALPTARISRQLR